MNPNVEAHTHAKITTGTYENKFGIAFEQVEGIYARARKLKNLRLRGLQMHIGSQITAVKPFEEAVRKVVPLVRKLNGPIRVRILQHRRRPGHRLQPGPGQRFADWWQSPPGKEIHDAGELRRAAGAAAPAAGPADSDGARPIHLGNAGILVTRVEYVKRTGRKNFVIVDAAMNDLIRPAFYESYHEIVPLTRKRRRR